MFLAKTSEDPDAGSPRGTLNEIELDVCSSMRNEPESIPYFATVFFNYKKYLAYCTLAEHIEALIIFILCTAAEYLIFFSQFHVDEYLDCFQTFASYKNFKKTAMIFLHIHYFTHVPNISLGKVLRSRFISQMTCVFHILIDIAKLSSIKTVADILVFKHYVFTASNEQG